MGNPYSTAATWHQGRQQRVRQGALAPTAWRLQLQMGVPAGIHPNLPLGTLTTSLAWSLLPSILSPSHSPYLTSLFLQRDLGDTRVSRG